MTDLPAHAQAEIKAAKGREKKSLVAFWDAWAAVGDAKDAERAAFQEVIDRTLEAVACRADAIAGKPGASLPPGVCGCGRHPQAVAAARKHRDQSRAKIDKAIKAFKVAG